MFFFYFISLLFIPSLQQASINYTESSLPSNATISDSKVSGYPWDIAIIGSFTQLTSATAPYIMQFAVDEINRNDSFCPGVKLQLRYAEVNNVQSMAVLATFYEILVQKVRGIAGGFFSSETSTIQLPAKIYGIPQISGKATTEDLSDKSSYPYFARATIGDKIQSAAVLDLFARYGWKQAILIFSNEVYGTSGNMVMVGSNLTFYSVQVANNGTVHFTDALVLIKKFVDEQGCRVFLFYVINAPAVSLFAQMNATWSGPEYVYIFTTPLTTGFVENPKNFSKYAPDFDGAIMVSAALGSGPVYEAEKPLWNALNPTLYPGMRPDPMSFWYWYDTIYMFAHALDSLMRSTGAINNLTLLDSIRGPQYFDAIMDVDFEGATGRVVLDSVGDRIGDAGVWNLRNGSAVLIGRYFGSNLSLSIFEEPTFFGGRTSVPPDSPTHILPLRVGANSIKIIFGVLNGVAIVLTFVITGFLLARPNDFRKKGTFYCGVILFGAFLAYIAALTTLAEPTNILCIAFPWFLGIGFKIVFGCMFLKTWVLFEVFQAADNMKKTNLNPYTILKILCGFVVVEVALLVIWTVYDPPRVELITVTGGTHRQYRCGAGNMAYWAVFIGYKGLWMLFGAVISFLVRNVRDDYNESAGVGMSVYNCFGVTVLAIVLGFVLKNSPDAVTIIENVAILVAFTATLILLFLRPILRILNILREEDIEPSVLPVPYIRRNTASEGASKEARKSKNSTTTSTINSKISKTSKNSSTTPVQTPVQTPVHTPVAQSPIQSIQSREAEV